MSYARLTGANVDCALDPRTAYSLAGRCTILVASITCLFITLSVALIYQIVASELTRMDDEILDVRLTTIRKILRAKDAAPTLLAHEVHEYIEGIRPIFVRVILPSGETWMETPDMPTTGQRKGGGDQDGQSAGVIGTPFTEEINGRRYRVLTVKDVVSDAGVDGSRIYGIHLAIDTHRDYVLIQHFRSAAVPLLIFGILLASLLAWYSTQLALTPLSQIGATAEQIDGTTLNARLNPNGLPKEVFELSSSLNGMLGRLERSHGALREFTDDVAHELRTPINNIRLSAEVALTRKRTEQEYQSTFESQLEECEQITRLISDLLFLARDSGTLSEPERQWIDIGRELEIVRDYFETAALRSGLQVVAEWEAGLMACVNRGLFQRAVANLLSNAIAHTPAGGMVRIEAQVLADRLRVIVADSGEGIATGDLPFVFDRFYRASHRRSEGDRMGLGLSIVKKIVEHHDGSITLESRPALGTRVTLEFPSRAGAQAAEP